MFNEEVFQEIGLHIVELPIELVNDFPVYRGYIKELPMISGEANSRQELSRELTERYAAYREQLIEEMTTEETETTSTLSVDQLLRYYDGETFDGFKIEEEDDPDRGKGWY